MNPLKLILGCAVAGIIALFTTSVIYIFLVSFLVFLVLLLLCISKIYSAYSESTEQLVDEHPVSTSSIDHKVDHHAEAEQDDETGSHEDGYRGDPLQVWSEDDDVVEDEPGVVDEYEKAGDTDAPQAHCQKGRAPSQETGDAGEVSCVPLQEDAVGSLSHLFFEAVVEKQCVLVHPGFFNERVYVQVSSVFV